MNPAQKKKQKSQESSLEAICHPCVVHCGLLFSVSLSFVCLSVMLSVTLGFIHSNTSGPETRVVWGDLRGWHLFMVKEHLSLS